MVVNLVLCFVRWELRWPTFLSCPFHLSLFSLPSKIHFLVSFSSIRQRLSYTSLVIWLRRRSPLIIRGSSFYLPYFINKLRELSFVAELAIRIIVKESKLSWQLTKKCKPHLPAMSFAVHVMRIKSSKQLKKQ